MRIKNIALQLQRLKQTEDIDEELALMIDAATDKILNSSDLTIPCESDTQQDKENMDLNRKETFVYKGSS